MSKIKCPHCGEHIEHAQRTNFTDTVIGNIIVVGFPIGLLCSYLIPFTIENGYKYNYDIITMLGFIIIYGIYAGLYVAGKNKGTFLLRKKDKNEK